MNREGWNKYKLWDLLDIKHGYAFKGEYFSDEPTDDVLLTPGNFKIGGGFKSDKFKYYKGEYPKDYILKAGDIVVTMTDLSKEGDTLGYSAMIPHNEKKRFLHNQRIGLLQFKNNDFDQSFIYWLLRTKEYQTFIVNSATGSTVKHTSPTRIKEYEFKAPSTVYTQARIADILSTLDEKIELNRQTNATLEAIAQSIFKEWFVDFNFPGETGEMVESELGMIPQGWRIRSLYDSATYINGAAYKNIPFSSDNSGLPIIKINELKYGITSQTNFTTAELDAKYKIDNGEILFSWSGSPDTSLDTFVWSGGPAWLNQHIFRVIPNCASETHFIYYLLKHLKPILIEIARDKQTTGLGHVTVQDLKRMQVLHPPDSVMQSFGKMVAPLYKRIFNYDLETRTLVILRDMLLPKLMSGVIKV